MQQRILCKELITEHTFTIINITRNIRIVFNWLTRLSPFSGLKVLGYKRKKLSHLQEYFFPYKHLLSNCKMQFRKHSITLQYAIRLSPINLFPMQVKKAQKPQKKLI